MANLPEHRLSILALCSCAALAACAASTNSDTFGPTPNNIALTGAAVTTAEDTSVSATIPITADRPEEVVLSAASGPSHGSLAIVSRTSLVYTPDPDFDGTDEVVIQAQDGFGPQYGQASAVLTITVTPVNDAPRPEDDGGLSAAGAPITIAQSALLANDRDPEGGALSFVSVQDAAHGSAVIQGDTVVFTPDLDFSGTATFTYTISDGSLSATATVRIDCQPSTHAAPVAVADSLSLTGSDDVIAIPTASLLANDRDPEGNPLAITRAGPLLVNSIDVGDITVNGTELDLKLKNGYTGVGQFSYVASNGFHEVTATVTLTVLPWPQSGDVEVFLLSDPLLEVAPGDTVTYSINVLGPVNHPIDVTVSDVVPADLDCTWTCKSHGGFGSCTASGSGSIHDTVRLDGEITYTLRCVVAASTSSAAIDNTVTITPASWFTDTKPDNNTSDWSLDVTP